MQTVGERLRRARERKAMTQVELGELAGIAHLTVLRIEQGRHRPRMPTLRRLSEALGVDPGWLLFGEESSDARDNH